MKLHVRPALLTLLLCTLFISSSFGQKRIGNPIMPGYFADPTILKHKGLYYIYATIDPWGADDLAVFVTRDFVTFDRKKINWPTKAACTSSTSKAAKVWAPSVVKGKDGLFHMFVSVGNEVWAGVASDPLGPWKNVKADNSPLVRENAFPGFHMIDAEAFIDTDGTAYLYWGSGWNWVNGHCFVGKLNKEMNGFFGKIEDITPPNYFEGPIMLKRNNTYYLMYSNGKAIDATYNVRYSTSSSPFGPWKEGPESPVLKTSADSTTYGPGHHTVFQENGQYYILYHRIFPQKNDYVLRQLCLDSLNFDKKGNIRRITPRGVSRFKVKP